MFPYFMLVAIPTSFAFFAKIGKTKNDKGNVVVTSFFLVFIALLSFRSTIIGNDTENYKVYFEYFNEVSWDEIFEIDLEPGFLLYTKLVSYISTNYNVYLFITSFIAVAPLWFFYRHDKECSFMTLALFLCVAPFHMYFSGLRQILAMVMALPAYYFSKKKKLILFALCVVVAFFLHRSAFIMIMLYPLARIKITPKVLWLVVPVIGTIFLFNEQVFIFLSIFINDYFSANVSSTGAYTILLLLVVFAVYSYLLPDKELIDEDTMYLRNILLLCICLQCFAPINSLAMRMNYYFLPFVPVLITRIANRSKEKNRKIAELSVIVMTAFFVLYFFFSVSSGKGLNIYPYVPFWRES